MPKKYVAVNQNTFLGMLNIYGVFNTWSEARKWIYAEGVKIVDEELWLIKELTVVKNNG